MPKQNPITCVCCLSHVNWRQYKWRLEDLLLLILALFMQVSLRTMVCNFIHYTHSSLQAFLQLQQVTMQTSSGSWAAGVWWGFRKAIDFSIKRYRLNGYISFVLWPSTLLPAWNTDMTLEVKLSHVVGAAGALPITCWYSPFVNSPQASYQRLPWLCTWVVLEATVSCLAGM